MAKVRAGFFALTEITDPTHHRAYNAWHQLDHMPEQFPLRGIVYGQRWVSTPACRRARAVDGGEFAAADYLTVYLMADPIHDTLRAFQSLADELHAAGRFTGSRRARLAGPYERTAVVAAPRVMVSAEAIPYRPNRGVYFVMRTWDEGGVSGPGAGRRPSRAARASADDQLATRLVDADGVAGVWSFASSRRFERHGWGTGERSMTLCYLDVEPLSVSPQLDAIVGDCAAPGATVVLAGPFETIVPWEWDWFEPPRPPVPGGGGPVTA
jgi:hypothetical protein